MLAVAGQVDVGEDERRGQQPGPHQDGGAGGLQIIRRERFTLGLIERLAVCKAGAIVTKL
ncbi:MAG TPA: hypothetical protein VGY96_22175 [Streptosporangiaceae bacterium]|nr:hypothetical protein [Streptosporangiaceae bacterium]